MTLTIQIENVGGFAESMRAEAYRRHKVALIDLFEFLRCLSEDPTPEWRTLSWSSRHSLILRELDIGIELAILYNTLRAGSR